MRKSEKYWSRENQRPRKQLNQSPKVTMKVDKELLKQVNNLSDSDARCLLVKAIEQGVEVEELLIRLDSEYAELALESVWINKLRKKNKRKREKLRFVVIENQKQEDFFEELFAQDLKGKEAA